MLPARESAIGLRVDSARAEQLTNEEHQIPRCSAYVAVSYGEQHHLTPRSVFASEIV